MYVSLEQKQLEKYIEKQLDVYLPDGYLVDEQILSLGIGRALERCEACFEHILLPNYRNAKKEAFFSHLHMDQYATFLYFLGNSIWTQTQEKILCDKILNLNRILNGFFISYKCDMPNVFVFAHPVGSIIGNARYSDGLYISQNVTINTDENLEIGRGCFLGVGAKIIGGQRIGDRCSFGTDVVIYNQQISDDSVCLNIDGKLQIRKRKSSQTKCAEVFDLVF